MRENFYLLSLKTTTDVLHQLSDSFSLWMSDSQLKIMRNTKSTYFEALNVSHDKKAFSLPKDFFDNLLENFLKPLIRTLKDKPLLDRLHQLKKGLRLLQKHVEKSERIKSPARLERLYQTFHHYTEQQIYPILKALKEQIKKQQEDITYSKRRVLKEASAFDAIRLASFKDQYARIHFFQKALCDVDRLSRDETADEKKLSYEDQLDFYWLLHIAQPSSIETLLEKKVSQLQTFYRRVKTAHEKMLEKTGSKHILDQMIRLQQSIIFYNRWCHHLANAQDESISVKKIRQLLSTDKLFFFRHYFSHIDLPLVLSVILRALENVSCEDFLEEAKTNRQKLIHQMIDQEAALVKKQGWMETVKAEAELFVERQAPFYLGKNVLRFSLAMMEKLGWKSRLPETLNQERLEYATGIGFFSLSLFVSSLVGYTYYPVSLLVDLCFRVNGFLKMGDSLDRFLARWFDGIRFDETVIVKSERFFRQAIGGLIHATISPEPFLVSTVSYSTAVISSSLSDAALERGAKALGLGVKCHEAISQVVRMTAYTQSYRLSLKALSPFVLTPKEREALRVLGLSSSDRHDAERIHQAYLEKAREFHTGAHARCETTECQASQAFFIESRHAYDTLRARK